MATGGDTLRYMPPSSLPPILNRQRHDQLSKHGYLFLPLIDPFFKRLQSLSAAASAFFDQDEDVKRARYPSAPDTEVGYYKVKDEKEYVTFRRGVNPDSRLTAEVGQVWREAGHLLYRILCELTQARGLPASVWSSLAEDAHVLPAADSDLSIHRTLVRVFRYYTTIGEAAPHVDIGLLTLCVGDGAGLQVLHRTGDKEEWLDCQGPTILIADTLRILLNGTVTTGYHRVIGNPNGRSSIVMALRPCLKSPIDMSSFGGYGLIDSKDFFREIQASKFNVNANKDIRDKQQAAFKEKQDQEIARLEALSNDQKHAESSLFSRMSAVLKSKRKSTSEQGSPS